MQELSTATFDKGINTKPVVIIDFWASWCGPCRAMAPTFEELSKEMPEILFAKVNVDDNQEIAVKYGIMGIPCFLIFKNGKEADRIVGVTQKAVMKAKLEAAEKR